MHDNRSPHPSDNGAPAGGGPPEDDGLPQDDGQSAPQNGEAGDTETAAFPVVGVGASAGGLRAFQAFFEALPDAPGMAFVVVQHLSPDHDSELAELLQAKTELTVAQVEDAPRLQPDHVYVIPPGKNLEVVDGHLQLSEPTRERGHRSPIDLFFRSLGDALGERAVCIVLSGTGSDGTLGLKAIKERGGLTMAQDPHDAEYDGMPRSAIGTGFVDITGSAAELADQLVEVRQAARLVDLPEDEDRLPVSDHDAMRQLFVRLREYTGHDFHDYKRSTILRRIGRRMQVSHVESLPAYLQFARDNPEELQALFRDFLISVTNFFRDPEAFDRLEAEVVPQLFEGKGAGDQVRVWVAGCATGEEAYSIGMLLCEHAATLDRAPDLQIFATDIDEEALDFAREGFYPTAVATDISPERLERFFEKRSNGYRVKPGLRETVLFASHNLIDDPPFSRLDLVSCRNLLIYLQRDVQTRAFGLFHYALRPGGFLFLGSSEAPDALTKTFREVGKRERLFQRRDNVAPATAFPVRTGAPLRTGRDGAQEQQRRGDRVDDRTLAERYRDWTLRRYAPPRLLVDEDFDITHVFGHAGRYLRDREGPATQNVVEKVQRALRLDLRAALFRAFKSGAVTETRFQRIEVGGEELVVRMRVGPVDEDGFPRGLAEIVFVELDPASVRLLGAAVPDLAADSEDPAVERLEEELRATRERLQATVEEQETSNEELKASNEELQSMNEELQSTTEELETSKEELQSMNEELTTVNQELKNKIEELGRANADLQNLMASTDIGTLFLDQRLHLKRFTPRAADLFNVIPSDVGRPFAHVSHQIDHGDLPALARSVLDDLQPVEEEMRDHDGRWYLVGMRPYRTEQNVIDGVTVTFVDIDETKRAQERAARRAAQQQAVAELGRAALGGAEPDALMRQAVEAVAETTSARFCKVLELDAEDGTLLLREGVGWDDGTVGTARVPHDAGSQAGYTLLTDGPVLVDDFADETRFESPALLSDHHAQSGISVTIPGPGASPFGVLGVHDTQPHHFETDDLRFVESVANVLSAALRRDRDETLIASQLAEIEAVYDTAPVGLALIDRDYRFVRINQLLADIDGRPVEEHLQRPVREILPALADQLEALYDRVLDEGESIVNVEIRGSTPRYPDEERVFLASYVPQRVEGEIVGINVVVRDVTDLIRTQERLAESERGLRLALEGGHLGAWSRNLRTGHVSFDRRARELFGLDEDMPFEEAFERVLAEDQAMVEAAIAQVVDPDVEDDTYAVDHRITLPDGSIRWMAARGRCYFEEDADGARRPVHLAGVVFDVTARKRAEARLAERERELQVALEGGRLGAWTYDYVTGRVEFDERACRIINMDPEMHIDEVMGRVYADDRDAIDAAISRVTDPGSDADTYEVEYRVEQPDGAVTWASTRGRAFFEADASGARRAVRLAGVVLDVTDRKKAEEQARRRLDEIASIYDTTAVGLCLLDRERRFVRINNRLAEIQGRSVEDHIGANPYELFPVITEEVQPNLEAVYESGRPLENVLYTLPVPSAPDQTRDWLVSYYPILDDAGAVEYVSITVQEVTELREVQRELEQLAAELERRVAERTQQVRLLANDLTQAEQRERSRIAQVLHDDLQQYLYALKMKAGQIEALTRREQDGRLDTLFAQCDRLFDETIQAARTLTVDLSPPILAGEGLDRSLEWLVPRMQDAYDLTILLDVEGDTEVDSSVHVLLFQFVRELLFNVVKHAGVSEAELHVARRGDMLRIEVRDRGRGFDPDALTPPNGEDRTGLGLFSVRERLALIGGELEIVSDPDGGTNVIIHAPVRI